MSPKIRILSLAGAAAVVLATPVLTMGTAEAASWLSDPGSCTNTATGASETVTGHTVEVRYGTCSGTQYGWGRIRSFGAGDYIRFEVDTNGDRSPDGSSWYLATNRNYTAAYPTSTSSSRAFRACLTYSGGQTCNSSGNATAWW